MVEGSGKTFLSIHGKYLSAQPDGSLQWNRDKAAQWEGFTIIKVGKKQYQIKSFHGKYVCAEQNGKAVVNRDKAAQWETVNIEKAQGKKVILTSRVLMENISQLNPMEM
jgi:hypothetical protein